jgi:hypothetical protein
VLTSLSILLEFYNTSLFGTFIVWNSSLLSMVACFQGLASNAFGKRIYKRIFPKKIPAQHRHLVSYEKGAQMLFLKEQDIYFGSYDEMQDFS